MPASPARLRAIADGLFGSGSPATWYLGVSRTVPNADNSGFTEPVGNNYSRPAIANNVANFPAAATVGGVTQKLNGAKFTFANPSGPWGDLLWFGFYLASSGIVVPEFAFPLDGSISPRSGNSPVEFDTNTLKMLFG